MSQPWDLNEQRFRLLVESVKDYAIFMLDPSGRVASWNAGAARIKGYAPIEIVGKHFSVFYPQADVEAGKCEIELVGALREGRFEDEGWRVRKDGSRFWANVVITAVRDEDGQLLGFAKVTRDLTTRLQQEQERLRRVRAEHVAELRSAELIQSEERMRLLVDSVKDYAIFMLDPQGRVASWNAGAQRIKGYEAAEIVGRHFSVFYPEAEVKAGKCELELERANRDGRFEDEGWRVRKDGTRFWANVIVAPARDADGNLVGFSKVTRDLTSRVQAEEERTRLARAEERERQKENFLAVMGHELRNPLAPMVGALHVINARRGLGCEKEVAILQRQVTHMMRLLDDLMDVSSALRDKVQLSTGKLPVGDVVHEALIIAGPRIEEKQHRVVREESEPNILVTIDGERMIQVFVNLFNNAAKYTDPGGTITVRIAARRDVVEVAVKDTGIGISPEMLPRVFDMFVQEQQSAARRVGGLGVGLAVAQRLVLAHGGVLLAHSDGLGQGATFTVRLARVNSGSHVTAPNVSEVQAVQPIAQSEATRRVLLVDDNEDGVEMMRIFLEDQGHEVHWARDGLEALAVAERITVDIAFLDIGLPGLSGFEVARALRRIPRYAKIPLIGLSGYARPTDKAQGLAAGFTAHFAKPMELNVLMQAVTSTSRNELV